MIDWEKAVVVVGSVVGWNAWLTREMMKMKDRYSKSAISTARLDQKVTDMHGWMRDMREDIKVIRKNGS